MTEATTAEINAAFRAYDAYGSVTDYKNFQGNPMPAWIDLPEKIQQAWIAAIRTATPKVELDEREQYAVDHAKMYSTGYSKAAIPGHSQLMLLAKLVKALRL